MSLIWYETGARHTAIVDGGLGSGKYKRDDIVTITAAAPTNGKTFNQWTGTEGVSFADAASTMTTFTMPDADVTVTATYKDMDTVAAPSTEYTGPIRITEETTISAIAIKEGMSPSDVVTAIYTIQTPSSENYTVIFKAAGGTWTDGTTTDKEVTVENGNAATAPEDPTREGFTFDSWDKDFSNVTSDLTVTAQWKENTTPPQPQEPISIEDAKVVLSVTSFNYNGRVRKPAIKTIGGKTLSEGTDYIAEWSNASSKNAGTYTVTITGKGNYAGTTSATYKIKKTANPLKLKEKNQ